VPWTRLKSVRTLSRRRSRLHLDESVPAAVERLLVARGYHATTTRQIGLVGHSDADQAAFAWREQRVLLTFDWDFFEPRNVPRHRSPAIVIVDCDRRRSEDVISAVDALSQLERLAGALARRSRAVVRADGEATIWTRSLPRHAPDFRYRFDGHWPPLTWR